MIKPCLWPWIASLSSRVHESWCRTGLIAATLPFFISLVVEGICVSLLVICIHSCFVRSCDFGVTLGGGELSILSILQTNFKGEEQRNCKVNKVWYQEDRTFFYRMLFALESKMCVCGAFSTLLWKAASTLCWPVFVSLQ